MLAALAVLGAPAAAQTAPPVVRSQPVAAPAPAANAAGRPALCLIEPARVAEIGAQVVGVVERVHADRGDSVRAGQPLVSLRADVERASAGVADTRSRIDADVRAAAANLELAQQKLTRTEALVAQAFLSPQALDQARGERELAAQRLAQARGQQQIWRQEQQVAQAQLRLRSLTSPISGVVVERYVQPGERVEERPLLRVAAIDTLRVELMLGAAHFGRVQRGDRLSLQPELASLGTVTATVTQIDKVLDAGSNTFRVRASLPNPGHRIPAGLRCRADLAALASPAAAAPASRGTTGMASKIERQSGLRLAPGLE